MSHQGRDSQPFDAAEIAEAKRRVPIDRLIRDQGVVLEAHGTELLGVCPIHPDKSPSLGVDMEKGLWHCRSRCGGGDHITWLEKAGGMRRADAIAHLLALAGMPRAVPKVVARYWYTDPDGTIIGLKERVEPGPKGKSKTFRWHHVDEAGQKASPAKKPTECATIYRAHEVKQAVTEGNVVVVVEGEKAADALARLGVCATSSEDGAGKWGPQHTRHFEGARVLVLPDNDAPGHAHAASVVRQLVPVATSVWRLSLPGLPEKGDVVDWLAAGHTVEEMWQLLDGASAIDDVGDLPPDPEGEAREKESDPIEQARKVAARELLTMRVLRKSDNEPRATFGNVLEILEKASRYRGMFAFDELRQRSVFALAPPWGTARDIGRAVTDDDAGECTRDMQTIYEFCPESGHVGKCIELLARKAPFSPVVRKLEELDHDGEARIDTWLMRYLGVKDTPYARAVGRRFLIAAVARAYEPGCQVDTALVLEGPQGGRKTSAVRALACGFISEDLPDMSNAKESAIQLQGAWIVELGELAGLKKADNERIKSFMSRQVDRYRPPYGAQLIEAKRRCVFIGTTNQTTYLTDDTGNRRWWPVAVGRIDIAALRADVMQLWAEAVIAYKTGSPWWLDADDMNAQAVAEQEERREQDPWTAEIEKWARDLMEVTTSDVLNQMKVPLWQSHRGHEQRAGAVLRHLGFERRRGPIVKGQRRGYIFRRPDDWEGPRVANGHLDEDPAAGAWGSLPLEEGPDDR